MYPSTPNKGQPYRIEVLSLLLSLTVGVWALQFFNDEPGAAGPGICSDSSKRERRLALHDTHWRTDHRAFIAHAGGGINGVTYTNSLEAITSSIARGYRLIELDLLVSSDGYIVAAHDWKTFRQRTGREVLAAEDQALSLSDFRARKIDDLFTPVDEQMIRGLLLQHPDLIIVTDKITDFPTLARALPLPERLVVGGFFPKDFVAAKLAGITHPMLSVGDLAGSFDFIRSNAVGHLAVSTRELLRCPGAAARLIESGVVVFSFTSNDADFMAKYLRSHVSAFYTDFWNVSTGRCDHGSCAPPTAGKTSTTGAQ